MKKTKHEQRSDETKRSILEAAGSLFASRGYDTVTMREIAKEAGCSHTAIYIHYKDKEALLHQLAEPPLIALRDRLAAIIASDAQPAIERVQQVTLTFVRFCLQYRAMVPILFTVRAERVDVATTELPINRLRNDLFDQLKAALGMSLPSSIDDMQRLMFARIYFFMIHGLAHTYIHNEEPTEDLLMRLTPTIKGAVNVMILGMKQQILSEAEGETI